MFTFVILSALIAVSATAPAPENLGLLGSPLGLSGNPWGHSGLSSGLALSADPWAPSHLSLAAPHSHLVAHQPLIAQQILTSQPIVSTVTQPEITGQIVQHVPTAVSHQSISQVHSSEVLTPVITPVQHNVISHTPVIQTIATPGPLTLSHGWNAPVLSSGHGWNAPVLSSGHGWNSPVLSSW